MKRVLRIIGLVLGSLLGIVLLAAGLLDTLPVEAVSHEVNVTAPEKRISLT